MDFDREYANGAFIDGAAEFPPRWRAKSADLRASAKSQLDIPYGPDPRNHLDLFLPETPPRGMLVFIHGGYWLDFDRRDFSHLAAGALARGWAAMLPSYTLAPQARITQITAQIDAAICAAAALVDGPIVITGHSAGGHLAARMGNDDALAQISTRTARVIPISPVAELEPLIQTEMNTRLRLDLAECADQSPARRPLRSGCAAHVWVGQDERPAFLWQARTLSERWSAPWAPAPNKHHFNVIDDLESPSSPLIGICLDGL